MLMSHRLPIVFLLLFASYAAMAVEEPKYRLILNAPPFERADKEARAHDSGSAVDRRNFLKSTEL
jgi:hypothetical protein